MAKERGLKGYSKLRKAELIVFMDEAAPKPEPSKVISAINTYVKPALVEVKKAFNWGKEKAKDVSSFINKNLNELIAWAKKPKQPKEKPSLSDYVKQELEERKFKIEESKSALKKFTTQYVIKGKNGYGPQTFLDKVRPDVVRLINANRKMKIKMILDCVMEKTSLLTGDVFTMQTAFHSHIEVNLEGSDADDMYTTMADKVMEALASFQREGSNWILQSIISLGIYTVKYEPLSGSSYIPLPLALLNKKAIINLKNEDEKCFMWSVLRALNQKEKDNERIDKDLKKKEDSLNMKGIEYPVSLNIIDKFEKQNVSISVNVFGYEEEVYPLRLSKHEHRHVVNLILISQGEMQHYCFIKNMSRL